MEIMNEFRILNATSIILLRSNYNGKFFGIKIMKFALISMV